MQKRVQNRGFSLIELLFAIFFLSVILLGVISLQTSNLVLTATQNNEIQAHFWANQGLEIVDALGYGSLGCGLPPCTKYISFDGTSTYSLSATQEPPIANIFNRSIKIETGLGPQSATVKSTITWNDNAGAHTVEAKRIIFQ